MITFYDRFKELSDEGLLERIKRKEHFQKEAVLAAYHILSQRGYELDNPFPGATISDVQPSIRRNKRTFIEREYHVWFKMIVQKKSLGFLVIFTFCFIMLLWFSGAFLKDTDFYRKIHLFSQTIIKLGGITYLIEIALIIILFISSKNSWNNFLKVKPSHLAVAVQVFLFSLVLMSAWEWLFADKITLVRIADNKTARELLGDFWFACLVAFTEELIFKWLLLTQLLLRVGNGSGNRRLVFFVVAVLFALSHIPVQLHDNTGVSAIYLFKTFLYSYFTSILFVKHRNLLLVVLLHFLVNISSIFVEANSLFYFNWSIIMLGLYCLPKISNSWLFKSNFNIKIPRWAFGSIVLLITAIILMSSKQPKDLYNFSRQYYFMNKYDKAMNLMNTAIAMEDHSAKFLNHRGNIYYDLHQYDLAWDNYNRAVEIDSDDYGFIRNRGLAAKQISKYKECVEDLTIAVINDIQTSRVYQNRGSCYLGIGEPELAISDFEQALKRNSSNDQAYYGLGRAYLKLKEFEKSSKNLELAINLDPNFIQAYEVLAMVYMGIGRYDSSNVVMTKAIEMGSSTPIRFYVRGLNYYEKEDYHNAVKEFEKSIEFNPEEPDLYLNLAYSYFFLENYVKGCEYLNKSAMLGNEQAKSDLINYCTKNP